jgi:ERCC4-type nuclease
MEWRRISVLHEDWDTNPGFNLVIRRSLASYYKTVGELSDAEGADPGCIMRVPGIGKVATAAIKNILTRYRNGVAPDRFYEPY